MAGAFEKFIECFRGSALHLAAYLDFSMRCPIGFGGVGFGCPPEVVEAINALEAGGFVVPDSRDAIWPFLEENPELLPTPIAHLEAITTKGQPEFLAHAREWRRYTFGQE